MSRKASGDLFILSAPSGTGKNTLIRQVFRLLGDDGRLAYSVSYTTRSPRKGEEDGVNYHFVDREAFDRMVDEDAFLEWAQYGGHHYGTAASEVLPRLERGTDVILEIEVQGAMMLLARCPEAHAIFLLPPDFSELKSRIVRRGLDDSAAIAARLEVARLEMERYGSYHYAIINDDLKRASQALAAIILDKRHRVARQEDRIASILEDFRER